MPKSILACLVLACLPTAASAATVVGTMSDLKSAISAANSGGDPEIVVQSGTYTFTSQYGLLLSRDGMTIRSQSGDPESVVLEGAGMSNSAVTHIFQVGADDVTIEGMTLCRVGDHAIQVHGETPYDADRPTIRDCVFEDTGQQMVKVSYRDGESSGSDGGLVEGCRFEFTAGIGPQYYIGGIDAHQAADWVVRGNEFRGIRSPGGGVAEHAVHFWSSSSNTLVERNLIVNCDRGIGFGLGSRGHSGGIIRNNMIYHANLGDAADVGIELESASGAVVVHNTVYLEHSYPAAISARFGASSGLTIENNLIHVNGNSPIWMRDGATSTTAGNVTNAQSGWFVDASSGDLHLKDASVSSVIDKAVPMPDVTDDFDGSSRPVGAGRDVGAHEYGGSAATTELRSWGTLKAAFRG